MIFVTAPYVDLKTRAEIWSRLMPFQTAFFKPQLSQIIIVVKAIPERINSIWKGYKSLFLSNNNELHIIAAALMQQ